jgi:hypothetical protein
MLSQSGDGSRNKAPTAEQDPRRCIAATNYSAERVSADAATAFDDLAICRVPRWPAGGRRFTISIATGPDYRAYLHLQRHPQLKQGIQLTLTLRFFESLYLQS